jgi:hypothetical protein
MTEDELREIFEKWYATNKEEVAIKYNYLATLDDLAFEAFRAGAECIETQG